MYSYSDIASMTIQELIDNHIKLNEDLINCIFKNPIIRDLPKLATLYGFYSRFIVGQTKIFFAYGTDQSVINGPFHEAEETVIPEYVVKKCGYFVSWNTNLLCPRCEVFEIPEKDTTRTYALSNRMMLLERMVNEYKEFELQIPEYIELSPSDYRRFMDFFHITDNRTIKENTAKESWKQRERQFLQDIAIWEWPMTLNGPKPGFTAFTAWSRYSIHSTNLDESLKVYNNPKMWQRIFESEESSLYHTMFVEPKNAAEYIMHGLDKMGIPYCRMREDKEIRKAAIHEKELLGNVLPDSFADMEKRVSFFISKYDEGAVIYWMREYTKTLFTPEQLRYGNELYYGTDWWNKGQDPAGYLFFVPAGAMQWFMKWAERHQVKIGYPDAGWLNRYSATGVYLITEYCNMPLINDAMHQTQHVDLSTHRIGMERNAPTEERTFHQNGKGVYMRKDNWEDRIINSVLQGSQWYHPIDELLKNGTMVDNKSPVLKQQTRQSSAEKKPAKKLNFKNLFN